MQKPVAEEGLRLSTAGRNINRADAVVHLGVGKNMVAAIRHWLKAFGIVDGNDNIKAIGHRIFSDDGFDPFVIYKTHIMDSLAQLVLSCFPNYEC